MTTIRIIILAQGQQARLPELRIPKQLLMLPSCNNVTILRRTLLQVATISRRSHLDETTTLVAGPQIRAFLEQDMEHPPYIQRLQHPGNSSLKGVYRYLTGALGPHDLNVVLLGDVVYSWACLADLMRQRDPALISAVPNTGTDMSRCSPASMTFSGTSDLSTSGGELWGVAWNDIADDQMMTMLAKALEHHPPFDDVYQPGQMRRWLWEYPGGITGATIRGHYTPIDDYTRDIDLPEHVTQLPTLSEAAAEDDKNHGINW